MLRPTHIHTSLAVVSGALLATYTVDPANYNIVMPAFDLPLLVGVTFGATIPDIDHDKSKINRVFGNIGKKLAHTLGHRTWTHTLWAIIIWFLIAYFVSLKPHMFGLFTQNMPTQNPICAMVWGVAWGNLLHILEDNFSLQGVLFLYPFTKFKTSQNGGSYKNRKWSNARYRTGSGAENAINLIMIVIYVAELWCFWHIWFH